MKFTKSILAGVFISIGATAFLITNNPFIFTIGIFLVFNFNALLITGYVPSSIYKGKFNALDTLQIALGNLVGSYLFGILIDNTRLINAIKPIADKLIKTKTNDSLLSIFILAVLCVALIGYGVIGANKVDNYLGKMFALMFPTFIFVVCGFEHMVANMFYITLSNKFIISIPFLLVSILGNIVGGIIIGFTQKYIEKEI